MIGAGISQINYYADRGVSALFGQMSALEVQTPAGLIAASVVQMTTQERIGREDYIVWRGINFEVDSDPVPARFGDGWITILKRVSP